MGAASPTCLYDADRIQCPAGIRATSRRHSAPTRGAFVSTRLFQTVPLTEPSIVAGSVLPIQRAEELLASLPGVISARIVASSNGTVEEIHILTTDEVSPKQTVRNVESALIAHLGMRVSHKKISVATSNEGRNQSPSAAPHGYTPQSTPPNGMEAIPALRSEKAERVELPK